MTWQPPDPQDLPDAWGYTEAQLLTVRQQTIEECAELAEMHDTCAPTYIADAIRKLGEVT